MAESSETDSILSQNEAGQDSHTKEIDNEKRFFALYLMNMKKKNDDVENLSLNDANFDPDDGFTCLSIAATNLAAGTETELRRSLSHKLVSKARPQGEGHIFSVGLSSPDNLSASACCYFCITKSSSDSLGFDHVTSEGETGGGGDDGDCQEFVVCFISFHDSSLDLFRTELDDYTKGLAPLLDNEPITSCFTRDSEFSSQIKQLNQLGSGIQSYLTQWPSAVLGYLPRTVECLGPELQHLIYAALLNANLQVSGADAHLEQDIRKFLQCCSLSALLEVPQTLNDGQTAPKGGGREEGEGWVEPESVCLTVEGGHASFDKTYSCQFVKSAAEKLMSHDMSNVARTREFLESVKLAFTHNLNKLKRFLNQGEVDFYALYRALTYLRHCGCGDLLLRYVKLEASEESHSVLAVLESFIKDTGISLS